MPFPFYDREDETQSLSRTARQVMEDCSRMIVLTGRRRIGKTTLCNHAFSSSSLI